MDCKLKFNSYVVNNIEFKNNMNFSGGSTKIDFDIDSELEFSDKNNFILGLQVEVFRNAEVNNYPFNFKVEVLGMFEITADSEEEKMKFAEKNAVAILFPYVRALITTFTSATNVQPIILPAINVAKYVETKKKVKE